MLINKKIVSVVLLTLSMLFSVASYADPKEESFSVVDVLRSTYFTGDMNQDSATSLLELYWVNGTQVVGEVVSATILNTFSKDLQKLKLNKKLQIGKTRLLVDNKIVKFGPEVKVIVDGKVKSVGSVVSSKTISKEKIAQYIREIEKANPKIKRMRYGSYILAVHAGALMVDNSLMLYYFYSGND